MYEYTHTHTRIPCMFECTLPTHLDPQPSFHRPLLSDLSSHLTDTVEVDREFPSQASWCCVYVVLWLWWLFTYSGLFFSEGLECGRGGEQGVYLSRECLLVAFPFESWLWRLGFWTADGECVSLPEPITCHQEPRSDVCLLPFGVALYWLSLKLEPFI